jgi:hypothetical protein
MKHYVKSRRKSRSSPAALGPALARQTQPSRSFFHQDPPSSPAGNPAPAVHPCGGGGCGGRLFRRLFLGRAVERSAAVFFAVSEVR